MQSLFIVLPFWRNELLLVTAGPPVGLLTVWLEYYVIFRHSLTSYIFCPECIFMICSLMIYV